MPRLDAAKVSKDDPQSTGPANALAPFPPTDAAVAQNCRTANKAGESAFRDIDRFVDGLHSLMTNSWRFSLARLLPMGSFCGFCLFIGRTVG